MRVSDRFLTQRVRKISFHVSDVSTLCTWNHRLPLQDTATFNYSPSYRRRLTIYPLQLLSYLLRKLYLLIRW